ncbi:ATP-binding cassette domain-containing protein [Cohnella panacarvi]|uniref:ATP-binding cassette domain-containing protein n=1 Tax=Cohnella panacarvi TaxID=400776 RepID=UPI00047A0DAA|nr:ABC transporter ATP-binding protein [Cohnella panacarvi]
MAMPNEAYRAASDPAIEAAVSLHGVKLASERFSLGPIDCDVPIGYVTAIVGTNGSGKSSLMRMLLGLEPIRSGEASVLGTRIVPGGDEGYKTRVGFLAELPHAHENAMTADEKAKFASQWYPSWDWERYRRLMRQFECDGGAKLNKLSKGMRRKVELSVTLAHDPELLLLDEPSSGLDPFAWRMMLDELQRYMDSGERTLVIATHITEEVRRLADYILFLDRGRYLGLYERDRLLDGWRTLLVQHVGGGSGSESALRRTPGLQGLTEAGAGVYRLEVDEPEQGEAYVRSAGFQVLASQRMELEDILSCLIRKEEAKR